ncbi:MAG: phosphoribosylformimino-5-aminoimidazole carboxamide ribotide isomerase, partial [Bacteroidota bacterium]|nr:phosphoribosylformimino-5-aminoimidazole carboxamide ribotide isomerase [Bacteroidota bacterium]
MFKPKLVIIPEIEISSGLCTSCIKGVKGTEGLYSNLSKNPLDLCLFWRKENAKILNLTNLDSYGAEETQLSSNAILYISFAMEKNIPLQLMSNFKSTEECCYYLDSGISRIVISQLLITDPNGVYNLIQKYSTNKIIFCVNSENGNAVFPDISPDISAISFANRTKEMGSHRIIYKKNYHGDDNQLFDIDELKDFYNQTGL